MAAVLVAAGNAAPKALASRISGTLALCGEQAVQANTASVFSQLLKGLDPLSDAQLLVRSHGVLQSRYSIACLYQKELLEILVVPLSWCPFLHAVAAL